MRFLSRGIVTLETAGGALILGMVAFGAFSLADFCSSQKDLRVAVDAAIAQHSTSLMRGEIGSDSDLHLFLDRGKAQSALRSIGETLSAQIKTSMQAMTEDKYSIVIEARGARFNEKTGKFEGWEGTPLLRTEGTLGYPKSSEKLDKIFSNLAEYGASPLGTIPGKPNYKFLPFAVLLGVAVSTDISHTPGSWILKSQNKEAILSDEKGTVLRGGLL